MSLYVYPLIFLPVVIDGPGDYLTRGGERVAISHASTRHDFQCTGSYSTCGTNDGWHKSGRLFAGPESRNDIVARA